MSYEASIQRSAPTALLFLIDQSGSMGDKMASSERSKSQFVADVLNKTLLDLVTLCTKAEGVRDYFHVGVIGYGGKGVHNGLAGQLGDAVLNPISVIEANPVRVDSRTKTVDDGAGGFIEQQVKFPVWFDALASGGTPMCAALMRAAQELAAWCDTHQQSYPPTVLHVTDGESSDGDPEGLANSLRQFATLDGNVLLLNLHVSSQAGSPIAFPADDAGLPDQYSKLLFRMSTVLPAHLLEYARQSGMPISSESRGFMFNADVKEIVKFFNIGTRPSQLR